MTDRLNAMGADVTEALTKIAEEMDVSISELDFEVEREQFFNATGQAIGLDTIKVFAWKKQLINGLLEMKEWLEKTLELMGFTATVSISDRKGVQFHIDSEEGGRIIGRKGSTLKSIQALMEENKKAQGYDWDFSIKVHGGEKKERTPREFDRKDGRRDKRSSKRDEEKLQRLAKKLAHKVVKSQEEIIIEKELNGFQRRVVHLTIKGMDGVVSESFMDNEVKKIRLLPVSVTEAVVEKDTEQSESE